MVTQSTRGGVAARTLLLASRQFGLGSQACNVVVYNGPDSVLLGAKRRLRLSVGRRKRVQSEVAKGNSKK